jgi:hypothetical protein
MQNVVTESLALLGTVMRDKVTQFEGMVSTVGFDAYGCVQAILSPMQLRDGKKQDGEWFDVKRLVPADDKKPKRIMDSPFAEPPAMGREKGPGEKPAMRSNPLP